MVGLATGRAYPLRRGAVGLPARFARPGARGILLFVMPAPRAIPPQPVYTTPFSRRRATSSAVFPNDFNTASVCCPKAGGAAWYTTGVPES